MMADFPEISSRFFTKQGCKKFSCAGGWAHQKSDRQKWRCIWCIVMIISYWLLWRVFLGSVLSVNDLNLLDATLFFWLTGFPHQQHATALATNIDRETPPVPQLPDGLSNDARVISFHIGGPPKIGGFYPQNGWFISWKTLFFNGWFGGAIIFGNTHIWVHNHTFWAKTTPSAHQRCLENHEILLQVFQVTHRTKPKLNSGCILYKLQVLLVNLTPNSMR